MRPNALTKIIIPSILFPMHETRILGSIFEYLNEEERAASRKIRKIHITLSEFGGINKERFLGHFKEKSKGSKWEILEIEIKKVPYGPELEITKLDFAQ